MTTITINAKNRTIELSNTFAKAASLFGSEEYRQLQEARRDYPSYRVVTVKQKGTGNAEFAKLSFKFMDKYVKDHANSDDLKAEYRSLRGLNADWEKDDNGFAEEFQIIKDWFLNAFPEFEQARKERIELLAKIKQEKEARLATRKKVA
jgi:hypothetical protein